MLSADRDGEISASPLAHVSCIHHASQHAKKMDYDSEPLASPS